MSITQGDGAETVKDMQEEPRLMAQWIVSLAVSVVCCAVLFIVFAGYIVDLHDALTLTTVRLEVTQEKLDHTAVEVETLRRALSPTQQPALSKGAIQPLDPSQVQQPANAAASREESQKVQDPASDQKQNPASVPAGNSEVQSKDQVQTEPKTEPSQRPQDAKPSSGPVTSAPSTPSPSKP